MGRKYSGERRRPGQDGERAKRITEPVRGSTAFPLPYRLSAGMNTTSGGELTGPGDVLRKASQKKLEKVETAFFQGLIELQYGQNVEKKLRSLAAKIPWAHGWPTKKQAFWNAEAFMWQRKIDKTRRQLITQEIEWEIKQEAAILAGRLSGKRNFGRRNLDLGCGAYSYLHSTAGVDLSAKMLALNERVEQKIPLDLEKLRLFRQRLPLPSAAFDSVTAVFLLNYLPKHAHPALFREIRRVLKKSGFFMVVLAAQSLEHRYRRQERAKLSCGQWKRGLRPFFQVKAYEKEKTWFFCCRK